MKTRPATVCEGQDRVRKRLARLLPWLALLTVTTITVLTLRSRAAARAWQPLPGGGQVRVLAVTHGAKHSIELDGSSWRDRARFAWRTRSLQPLTRRPIRHIDRSTGKPTLVFWLEGRQAPNSKWQLPRGVLVLPDGQPIQDSGNGGDGAARADGRWEVSLTFPVVPARAQSLHLITRFNGGCQEFDVPNPAYRTDLPVWKAEPLPQTQRHGAITLTLTGVNLYGSKNGGPDSPPFVYFNAQPLWQVRHGEMPGERFYAIAAVFEDPAGNVSRDLALFSEPVWKVRATISRGVGFPFVSEEERSIGPFEPFTLEFFFAAPEPPPQQTAPATR